MWFCLPSTGPPSTPSLSPRALPGWTPNFCPPPWNNQFSSWAPLTFMEFPWAGYLSSGNCAVTLQVILCLPAVSLGTGGCPRKAQARWARSKCDLPQCSLQPLPSHGDAWCPLSPTLGLEASAWVLGMGVAGSTLAGPHYPQPPQPTPGWCVGHKQLPGRCQTTLHQAGTGCLPISTAALTGATFSAHVMVPVCTREENALPLGNDLQSGGEP